MMTTSTCKAAVGDKIHGGPLLLTMEHLQNLNLSAAFSIEENAHMLFAYVHSTPKSIGPPIDDGDITFPIGGDWWKEAPDYMVLSSWSLMHKSPHHG